MALATWRRGEELLALPSLPNFHAGRSRDAGLLARLAHLSIDEAQARLSQMHRPYVAWMDDTPVAYGWVATQTAHVGELNLTIILPVDTRYLWDFATLPEWRGRGIYPRLLQAIMMAEAQEVEHLWIIAAPENRASSAGIAKAGFTRIAQLSFEQHGLPRLISLEDTDRAIVAESLLRVPLLEAQAVVAPCWRCAIEANKTGQTLTDISCWPTVSGADIALTACSCGMQ